jgi:hypothetical protein
VPRQSECDASAGLMVVDGEAPRCKVTMLKRCGSVARKTQCPKIGNIRTFERAKRLIFRLLGLELRRTVSYFSMENGDIRHG